MSVGRLSRREEREYGFDEAERSAVKGRERSCWLCLLES